MAPSQVETARRDEPALPREISTAHRVGFALLALFLVVAALAQIVSLGGILLPASLAPFAVGLILVIRRNPDGAARGVAFVALAYVIAFALAFLAANPITIGKTGYWVNADPPEAAVSLYLALATYLPFLLAIGAGVVTWPPSAKAGRILVAVGCGLAVAAFLLGFLTTPGSAEPRAVEEARVIAGLATNAFAAGCLALTAAIAVLLFAPRASA